MNNLLAVKDGTLEKGQEERVGAGGKPSESCKGCQMKCNYLEMNQENMPLSLSLSLSLPQPWSPFHTALAFLGSCLEASYFFLAHHKVACNSHYPRLPQFLYQFLHLPICLPISLLFCLILFVLSFVFIILVTNENGGWAAAHLPSFFIIF